MPLDAEECQEGVQGMLEGYQGAPVAPDRAP